MGKLTEKETQKKYYFIDNGLLNFLNAEKEIDFIVPDEKLAIQVSYSIKMTQHFEEIAEIGVLNFEEFVLLDKKILRKCDKTLFLCCRIMSYGTE